MSKKQGDLLTAVANYRIYTIFNEQELQPGTDAAPTHLWLPTNRTSRHWRAATRLRLEPGAGAGSGRIQRSLQAGLQQLRPEQRQLPAGVAGEWLSAMLHAVQYVHDLMLPLLFFV